MNNYLSEIIKLEERYFNSSLHFTDNIKVFYEDDISLKGYLIYSIVCDEAEIISLFVKEENRRCKIATKLLLRLKQVAKTIFLEVNEKNISAYKLYLKEGFTVYGKREKYYNNIDTALLMKWSDENC